MEVVEAVDALRTMAVAVAVITAVVMDASAAQRGMMVVEAWVMQETGKTEETGIADEAWLTAEDWVRPEEVTVTQEVTTTSEDRTTAAVAVASEEARTAPAAEATRTTGVGG